ncbi:hypothetical protein BJX96DRAFT_153330, partial [Aspergillus floccosus]
GDQNPTVFSRTASTPPWCLFHQTAGLILRRTCNRIILRVDKLSGVLWVYGVPIEVPARYVPEHNPMVGGW